MIDKAPAKLSEAAKLMHSMSSEVSNFEIALRILAQKKEWNLSTTGRSKLFIQVFCKLDVIFELFDVIADISGNNDSLLDIVS